MRQSVLPLLALLTGNMGYHVLGYENDIKYLVHHTYQLIEKCFLSKVWNENFFNTVTLTEAITAEMSTELLWKNVSNVASALERGGVGRDLASQLTCDCETFLVRFFLNAKLVTKDK